MANGDGRGRAAVLLEIGFSQLRPPTFSLPVPRTTALMVRLRTTIGPETHTVTAFQSSVYTLLSTSVPAGSVTTYGGLAAALGTCARAVGGAMRSNPFSCGVMP